MKLLSSVEKYRSEIFRVMEERATVSKDFELKRTIVEHGGSAVMLAVDEKRRILLVRQFRLPARAFLWELPAGRLDSGETPLKAAKRELTEETGYRAKRWEKLASFYPSPGYVSEKMTIYLATDLTPGQAQPMGDEKIETRWVTARELSEWIETGKIVDAKTMIGYYAWKQRRR